MPTMNPDILRNLWKLGNALAKALRAPGPNAEADPQWRVSALASRAWKITHPDLPIVEDDQGMTKDTLLQLHLQQDPQSGQWFIVAQNKVVGPETHASPRALIVAKKDTPPDDSWDYDEIATASANFFRQQKKELVEKAKALSPSQPPGDVGPETPQPGAGGAPMAASRRQRLIREIFS